MLNAYLGMLDPPDLPGARRLAIRSLDQGMDGVALIEEVLVPAQEQVGLRWQRNEYTVPQEHAATAITDAVLALIAARSPGGATVPGRVVTCCVEGEWHTLPVRMVNDILAMQGYDVVFLGPSVPSVQLAGFLRDVGPVAVVASCTVATNLAGARRTIQASHDAGVPVIIGGRALGADGTRAAKLGADGWVARASDAGELLTEWTRRPPVLGQPRDVEPEQAGLERPAPAVVDECLAMLLEREPRLREMTSMQVERTREDIGYILQFCSAALVADDRTVFVDFTVWLREVLAQRGVPPTAVAAGYHAIAEVLGAGFPAAVEMLADSSFILDP